MARQSFISNLGGYALKKLRLLVNGNTHEYDTTQPVDVTITSGKQISIISTDNSVDVDEHSTAQSVTFDLSAKQAGSCLLTLPSAPQTFDGTDVTLRYIWNTGTPAGATGNKIRLATKADETNYRVEVAALGAYRVEAIFYVRWDGTPVNKIGNFYGFTLDFSRNFNYTLGRISQVIEIPYNQQPYYGFGFPLPASYIDAPNGLKYAMQLMVEYLSPI